MGHVAANVPLSSISIAYAILFYFSFAVFAAGVAFKLRCAARRKAEGTDGRRGLFDILILGALLRHGPLAWIASVVLAAGLFLVAVRHARFAFDASWAGPLWHLEVLAQPAGFYAGFAVVAAALGVLAFRLTAENKGGLKRLLALLVPVLIAATAASGYALQSSPASLVAMKSFFIGLVTFDWRPLPADPMLLAHLWLAASVLVLAPFGGILVRPARTDGGIGRPEGLGLRHYLGAALAALLLLQGGFTAASIALKPAAQPVPVDYAKLVRGHWSADPAVMTGLHADFLKHQEEVTVNQGIRKADNTIERCVTCHAVNDAEGRAVSSADPRHFCTQCHVQQAVATNCFTCHNSEPAVGAAPKIENAETLKARVAEWAAQQQKERSARR